MIPLIKTALFTLVAPGTVAVLLPCLLAARGKQPPLEIGPLKYAGAVPILAGAALFLWCAYLFAVTGRGTPAPIDPPKELVAQGPYRFVRNPMYLGIFAVLAGEAVLFESRILSQYAGTVVLVFYLFVVVYEEPSLRRRFGPSYQRYLEAVPRFIPRPRA